MAVLGLSRWYIAVVILGRDFKWACVERDEELIKNLISIESDFWNNHVLPRIIPDPDGSEIYDDILQKYFKDVKKEKTIELIGFDEELKRRQELLLLQDKLEAEKNAIDQKLKLYMKDSEYAVNDRYRISWSGVKKSSIDSKRLKEEQPDIYSKYLKSSEYRRFVVKESA
jgi:predicted phage-related endonuclease